MAISAPRYLAIRLDEGIELVSRHRALSSDRDSATQIAAGTKGETGKAGKKMSIRVPRQFAGPYVVNVLDNAYSRSQ